MTSGPLVADAAPLPVPAAYGRVRVMEPERELVQRAQAGDARAFEQLAIYHEPAALRLAYAITRSKVDAEDATQEAFIRAFRALKTFDSSRPFRPWMLQITANEASSVRRGHARRGALLERALADPSLWRDVTSSPHAAIEAHDALIRRLATCDQRDRAVITCRLLLDLSELETAAVLGWRP